jgi:hypothetical protein
LFTPSCAVAPYGAPDHVWVFEVVVGTGAAGRLKCAVAIIAATVALAASVTVQFASASQRTTPAVNHVAIVVPESTLAAGGVQTLDAVSDAEPGDIVEFTLGTNPPVGLLGITIHLCQTGFATYSAEQFGFDGPNGTRCVYQPGIEAGTGLTPQDATYVMGPDAYNGTPQIAPPYDFKVGAGHVAWNNASKVSSSLDCDATHPCDIVIQLEATSGTAIAILTVNYASDVVVTTTTTTSTTTTTTTTPPATDPPTTTPPVLVAAPPATVSPSHASLALTGAPAVRDQLSIALALLAVGLLALAQSMRRSHPRSSRNQSVRSSST